MSEKSAWLEIELPEPLGVKKFFTIEEFQKWFQEESRDFRTRFATQQDKAPFDHGLEALQSIQQELKSVEESHPTETTTLKRLCDRCFAKSVPPTGTRAAIHMNRARKNYGDSVASYAAYLLLFIYQNSKFPPKHESTNGAVLAQLFMENVQFGLQEELVESLHSQLEKMGNTYETMFKTLETNFNNLHKEKTTQFAKLEEDYKNIRSLEEPAKYWSTKRNGHRYLTWLFGAGFAAILLFGGRYLVAQAEQVSTAIDQIQDPKPYHWVAHAFPLFVVGIGLFWVLRILARILFQQLHLLSDSGERATMVNTYLSLLVGKGVLDGQPGVDSEDKKIILNQLFRPGQQGLKLEDAAPHVGAVTILTGDK